MYTNTTLITLLILSISLSSCSEEKIIEDKKEVNKLELKVKLDTIKITESDLFTDGPKSYQIYSGQILTYEFIDKPSTGTETSFKLSSENLIIKDTMYRPLNIPDYNSPEPECGGDESKVTLIFQGKKPGTCQLQIQLEGRAYLDRIVTFGILIK